MWKNTQRWMTGSLTLLLLYCGNLCTGHMYHYTRTHSLFAHLAVGLVRAISLFLRLNGHLCLERLFFSFFPPNKYIKTFTKCLFKKKNLCLFLWIFFSLLVKTQPLRSIQSPPVVKLTAVGSQFYIYMLCLHLMISFLRSGTGEAALPCWKWQCQHRCSIDRVCVCVRMCVRMCFNRNK